MDFLLIQGEKRGQATFEGKEVQLVSIPAETRRIIRRIKDAATTLVGETTVPLPDRDGPCGDLWELNFNPKEGTMRVLSAFVTMSISRDVLE